MVKRSLVGYSSLGLKELDMTETNTQTYIVQKKTEMILNGEKLSRRAEARKCKLTVKYKCDPWLLSLVTLTYVRAPGGASVKPNCQCW